MRLLNGRARLRTVLLAACAGCTFVSLPAYAQQAAEVSYTIRAQDLGSALVSLGRQSNREILFAADLTKGKRAPQLAGRMSVEEALDRLLRGSGLAYRINGSGAIVISQGSSASAASGATGPGASVSAQAAAQQDDAAIGEIIVTAQKREENLSDVPMSISAVTGTSMAESGNTTLEDVFARIPGLNLATGIGTTSGNQLISMRGLVTNAISNPGVAVTIGDVPYGSSTRNGRGGLLFPDIDPSAISRIEVLRGPQGTLYGASSIGGVLKFVLAEPTFDRVSGSARASLQHIQYGDVGYGLSALVNVPLSGNLGIVVSGSTRDDTGYVTNLETGKLANESETDSGSAVALWEPTDFASLKVEGLYQQTKGFGGSFVDTDENFVPLEKFTHSSVPNSNSYESKVRLVTATAEIDFGPLMLTSVTSYNKNTYATKQDASGFVGPFSTMAAVQAVFPDATNGFILNTVSTRRLTEELRFSGTIADTVDWVIGGFYSNEKSPYYQTASNADPVTGAVLGDAVRYDIVTTVKEHAVFGNLVVNITDRIDVQLGARQAWASQKYDEMDYFPDPITGEFEPDPFGPYLYTAKDDSFTYLVTPRFRITDDVMVYARYATGYRIGGINPFADFSGNPVFFGPDEVISWEAGVKGSALGGDLRFDVSGYYIDWKDIQIQLVLEGSNFPFTGNAGKVVSKGIELSLDATPFAGLDISLNGSYGAAKLDEALPVGSPSLPVGEPGDRLPFGAELQGSLSIDKSFEIGSATATVGVTGSHVGSRYGEFVVATAERDKIGGFSQLDLHASIDFDSWRANVYVNNVTNEDGILGVARDSFTLGSPYNATFIRPRTYGLSVSTEF